MRPVPAIDTIGDSVSLALIQGGIVAGFCPPRTFSAINPVDICPVEPPPMPWFNPHDSPDTTAITQFPEAKLPMTMHQRIYQWPAQGTGPVRTQNPSWATVPQEVPSTQMEWPVPVIPMVEMIFEERPPVPNGLVTETVIPQRGNSLRDFWTLYPKAPWVTVPLMLTKVGDSKVFKVTGVTYDRLGVTPVGGCRVVAMCTCSVKFGQPAYVVGETVSDGSGNYSLNVTSREVQILVYKDGSPDLSGTSKKLIEGTATIFMRDPTQADTPSGGGSGVSRGRIVNASS